MAEVTIKKAPKVNKECLKMVNAIMDNDNKTFYESLNVLINTVIKRRLNKAEKETSLF